MRCCGILLISRFSKINQRLQLRKKKLGDAHDTPPKGSSDGIGSIPLGDNDPQYDPKLKTKPPYVTVAPPA
ncbi:unnamed protein product [Cuscuta campestris]|uniref:Uncharacterized protein n=1 Tax=Cuscuta campestris TaxID=132261 RepID=A0A484LW59_9ASTE|nr:unnamed protein product [Cuscuta campestris]